MKHARFHCIFRAPYHGGNFTVVHLPVVRETIIARCSGANALRALTAKFSTSNCRIMLSSCSRRACPISSKETSPEARFK